MITSTTAIATPKLWVPSLLAAHHLSPMFQLLEHNQVKEEIVSGEHYIVALSNTPESTIKAIAWRILRAGFPCSVYSLGSSLPLEYLAPDPTTARELTVQIFQHALPFDDWRAAKDHQPLDLYKAADLAKLAIALLPESKKLVELGTLRKRSGERPYDWNKLMRSLEKEFQLELSKRGIKVPDDNHEQFRLDLLSFLEETDPLRKVLFRSKICSFYRLKKDDFEKSLKLLTNPNTIEEPKLLGVDQLFALEEEGLQWLIPELLPKGETIILAGSPKAGKTVLAIDAAFALATGESKFLGEVNTRGKVLLVSCDESLNSTRNKLLKRGIRSQDKDLKILSRWTIDKLDVLEKHLEDFRPDVVIIDSLRRISHGSLISENSAEFADNIYTLKETIAKYGASGILIHHSNKNLESMGVNKIRGSSAIAGAVWGTWQLEHIPRRDPNNKKKLIIDPKDPYRVLSIFTRDTEGQTFNLEFNYEDNSWTRLDHQIRAEQQTIRQQILSILTQNAQSRGLSGREIIELLGMTTENGRGVYTELNRMVNKKLICINQVTGDKRINLYSLLMTPQQISVGENLLSPLPINLIVEHDSESSTQPQFDITQQPPDPSIFDFSKNESITTQSNPPVEFSNEVPTSVTGTLNTSEKNQGECLSDSQSESQHINEFENNTEVSIQDSQCSDSEFSTLSESTQDNGQPSSAAVSPIVTNNEELPSNPELRD